jgi:hypothetical protein
MFYREQHHLYLAEYLLYHAGNARPLIEIKHLINQDLGCHILKLLFSSVCEW